MLMPCQMSRSLGGHLDPLGGLRTGLGPPFFKQHPRSFHQNSSSSQLYWGVLQQFFLSFHLESLLQVGWSPSSSHGCFGTQYLQGGLVQETLNDAGMRTYSSCANNSSWGRIDPFCSDGSAPFDTQRRLNVPRSARSVAPGLHTAALLGVPEVVVAARITAASFQSWLNMSRGRYGVGEGNPQSNCSEHREEEHDLVLRCLLRCWSWKL